MNIKDIKLKETSFACPEQYEAFYKKKQVGYLRLRHNQFTVEYPNCGGQLLFVAHPKGDGRFDEDERDYYLNLAKDVILMKLEDKI